MVATEPTLPLDDLIVVELGDEIAPAYTGKLLAELGANVIRVDKQGGGALYRTAPLIGHDHTGLPVGAPYLHLNRNKKSIYLNIDTLDGQELLGKLLAKADILVDGLGIDQIAAVGFSHATLLANLPKLIVASITPFGLSGPYRDLPASDLTVVALGGLLNMVGFPEREPLKLGGSQTQYAAGLSTFTGIMAALYYRDQTSIGQLIDVSMLETIAFAEWKSGAYFEGDGRVRYRVGNQSHWLVLPANDGYVALVYQDDNISGLVKLTGVEELADERFATRPGRAKHAEEIKTLLAPWFAGRSKIEAYHQGQACGVPLGFVATTEDLLSSPQYEARGFWQIVDHPTTGPIKHPGIPYQMQGISHRTERAPVPGEHTAHILESILELTDTQVADYRQREVI